jgi:hypothetical protein
VDLMLLALVAGAFGMSATAHLVLVVRALREGPAWRGLVALLVPPLAAYWGYRSRSRAWSGVWLGSLVVYLIALALANAG